MLSVVFCKVLGLFVSLPRPLKWKCPVDWKLRFLKTWHNYFDLLYKYRLLCILPSSCVFRSNFFASACSLVNISIKDSRCHNILFYGTMRCDFIIYLVTNKKRLKKLKIFICLERTSQLKWNRKYIKPMLQKCNFLEKLAINCDIKYWPRI